MLDSGTRLVDARKAPSGARDFGPDELLGEVITKDPGGGG
jgi:hypothetical protein